LGISQEELAALAEVDRSYMGGIERGDHNPTLMTMLRVANALGTSLHALIEAANV
jgi:transcriptional regulator with XRE-family HTH domain